MARTKNCPRPAPTNPTPSPSQSPSPDLSLPPPPPLVNMTIPTASLPSPSLPSPPPLPPIVSRTSTPAIKSTPSAPRAQIVVGPPRKKLTYPGPLVKGQVGAIFFSLDRPRNYMEIPHGFSLIVQSFHMRFRHELVDSKYVIVDPLGNSWSAPEVFTQWRRCIKNHEVEDLDLSKVRLAIVRYGNTFKLCTSSKKNNYKDYTRFIPALELDEEDPREKSDPDFVLDEK